MSQTPNPRECLNKFSNASNCTSERQCAASGFALDGELLTITQATQCREILPFKNGLPGFSVARELNLIDCGVGPYLYVDTGPLDPKTCLLQMQSLAWGTDRTKIGIWIMMYAFLTVAPPSGIHPVVGRGQLDGLPCRP